jgi:Uri superfamily endonuclease
MKGLKYDFISQGTDTITNEKVKNERLKHEKNKLGFIAQELEKIVPEAVLYKEEEDRYYIDYIAIIPVIVEAMKEQQVHIDKLESEISNLKSTSKEKSTSLGTEDGQIATLGQNIPNPFNENTQIAISLPKSVNKATLYIYNMQGVQIKSFSLNERGDTSVTIEGNSLKAGMYLYTLIANGKEVDTKKMILTK